MIAIGKEYDNITWKKTLLVCSQHFQESDYRDGTERQLLKLSAIPSLKLTHNKPAIFETPMEIYKYPQTSTSCLQKSPISTENIFDTHTIPVYCVSSTSSSDSNASRKRKVMLLD